MLFSRWFLFFLVFQIIVAADIGSDTAVNRFFNQQILNSGDRVAGFAALQGGFALLSMTTTATFDSFFPVTGNVALNGGTLVLDQDLIFFETTQLQTLGNIVGNNHVMELAAMMNCIPTRFDSLPNCQAVLSDEASQADDITSVDWAFDSRFIAIGLDDQGTSHDVVRIYELVGSSLVLRTSSLIGSFTEITHLDWHPFEYLLAVSRIDISGSTPELLIFLFNPITYTLTLTDSIDFDVDVISVAWHPTGNYLAVALEETGSVTEEVALYEVDSSGIITTPALDTFDFSGTRDISSKAFDWDLTGSFLAVGVKQGSDEEIFVLEFDGISLTQNAAFETNQLVNTLVWNPVYEHILAAGLDGSPNKLRLFEHDPDLGTLSQVESVSSNIVVHSAVWSPNGMCLATGWNNGNFVIYAYDPDTNNLTQEFVRSVSGRILDVSWSPDGTSVAHGGFNNILSVYGTNAGAILINPIDCVTFSDLNIVLNCDTKFQDCCILFSGVSSINGRGYKLTLMPTCSVIVDSQSSLLFKDITLKGIANNRVQALDDTVTFSFNNATLVLDDNFSFTHGHFEVLSDTTLQGKEKIFSYEVDVVSTITRNASFTVDMGVTFSYAPPMNVTSLIDFIDHTSLLILNSGTLHAATTSLNLLKGMVRIDGRSVLSSESTLPSEAVRFGDGVTAAHNCALKVSGCVEVDTGVVEILNI